MPGLSTGDEQPGMTLDFFPICGGLAGPCVRRLILHDPQLAPEPFRTSPGFLLARYGGPMRGFAQTG